MNENGRDHFEIPNNMRSMAEAGFEQARKAFERFISSAQAASDSLSARTATVGAGAKDASAVAFSYAEKNVRASLDYAEARCTPKTSARSCGCTANTRRPKFGR